MRILLSILLLTMSLEAQVIVTAIQKKKPVTSSMPARITFGVGSTSGTTAGVGASGNNSFSVTLPTGWSAGQVAFMVVYTDQGDASTPTNWTEVTGSPFGSATPKLLVFYKTLWSGDGNPSTTISGSTGTLGSSGAIVTFNNVDTNNVIDAVGTASVGTGTPMTNGGVTTTYDSSWVIGFCGRGDNEAASSQSIDGSTSGVTERTDAGTATGDDSQVSVYTKELLTKGASGNGSATTSPTDPWVSVMIGIRRKSYL